MKRKTDIPGMVRYKKLGGGSFHATIGGKRRIIKKNEIFDAQPEEIPEAFRDMVVPLDPSVAQAADKPAQKKAPTALKYYVKKREKARGYFDVVDKNGKVQNEKALRKDAAEALIQKLLG